MDISCNYKLNTSACRQFSQCPWGWKGHLSSGRVLGLLTTTTKQLKTGPALRPKLQGSTVKHTVFFPLSSSKKGEKRIQNRKRCSTSLMIQFRSLAQSCPILCDPMNHTVPGLPVHHQLMCITSVMPSSHLILGRSLLLLPPIPPSIMVFSNESTLPMRWPKYWSFSFRISPSNEHSGLISFRMD